MLFVIKIYQKFISPFFYPRCRYYPTCSNYAYQSISVHGIFLGCLLTFFRILNCNPLSKGGIDIVPPKGFLKKIW